MRLLTFKSILPFLFTATFVTTSALRAQTAPAPAPQVSAEIKNSLCRVGIYNPFVGAWDESLSITGVGNSNSLIVLNQGGTLIETDGVDLLNPQRPTSPGYGAWRALDCEHYVVTIKKVIYNAAAKRFESTVLHGTVLLSPDANSWLATLEQNFYNDAGNIERTDTVIASATRIKAEPNF